MTVFVPKILYQNEITKILDEIRFNYGTLTRKGYMYGLIAIDQDAKIIAIDTRFDRKLNYWDLSSIGAALYGVARQGQDFFEADALDLASIFYNNMQLFVKSIGKVELKKKGLREILIVILTDKDVNIGVIILQMSKFAEKIKEKITKDNSIITTLQLNETELKEHLNALKKGILNGKIETVP